MERPKILITRRWPAEVETLLAREFDVTCNEADVALDGAALSVALQSHDIVCPTVTDRLDRTVIGAGPVRAKALCNFGAGTNHIDLEACRAIGLRVTNTPDVLSEDTADLALLLAIMCARRASEGERLARAGSWTGWATTQLLGQRLEGKTFGVIGFGRIGQAAARRAQRWFGMDVVYAARHPPAVDPSIVGARRLALEELLATADVVSLHVPGGPETHHLIDARGLALMKRSAILVNTARGDVVSEDALADALEHGRLFGAGLDVHEREPAISPRLAALPNVVLLPHLGSATIETRVAMGLRAIANIRAIVAGQEPRDSLV